MESLGWDVEIVSSVQQTPRGPLPFHNVVATLDPSAPRRLVLACHYDSLSKPKGFLGATDSAVPCAMMINLAYTMRRDLQEDKRNVRNHIQWKSKVCLESICARCYNAQLCHNHRMRGTPAFM